MTHWADVQAEALPAGPHVFATAITPSGPIHLGNMREVLTTEAIFRATRQRGVPAELLYIADDYDPLRRVYPFLDESYEQYVGVPLAEVPCPCGEHASYSQHFLEPFLANLEALGIRPTVRSAYAMYREGLYVDHCVTALDRIDEVRAIIEEVSKRQLPRTWAPFHPQCPTCRRVMGTEVLLYEFPELRCRCTACAGDHEDPEAGTFTVDIRQGGIGKLPWRLDWPARWDFLGVSFEAFGKDHGAKGGSWDTGVRLAREVFAGREPAHVMYEFLNLKGKGAMHSSTGLAVSADEVLRMTPPEVLRYLLMRQSPRKHIDFDPGLGLLNLVDEFDRLERVYFGVEENPGDLTEVERTYELSCPGPPPSRLPHRASYRHLVTVVQMTDSHEGVQAILERAGVLPALDEDEKALLSERVDHVQYWIQNFAPEQVRFQIQESLPALDLSREDRSFLAALADALEACPWNGKDIHDAVYAAVEPTGRKPGQAFRALYRAILDQDRGPRAGFFLASLDRAWVVDRLREAS